MLPLAGYPSRKLANASPPDAVGVDEVNDCVKLKVPADELKAITQSFLTTHYLDQETNAAQAGALARDELIGGGWQNGLNLLDKVRTVTPQDVRRVANTYMRNLQFVVLGSTEKIDRQTFLRQPGR